MPLTQAARYIKVSHLVLAYHFARCSGRYEGATCADVFLLLSTDTSAHETNPFCSLAHCMFVTETLSVLGVGEGITWSRGLNSLGCCRFLSLAHLLHGLFGQLHVEGAPMQLGMQVSCLVLYAKHRRRMLSSLAVTGLHACTCHLPKGAQQCNVVVVCMPASAVGHTAFAIICT